MLTVTTRVAPTVTPRETTAKLVYRDSFLPATAVTVQFSRR